MRCGPGLSNFTGRPNHLCATQSFALGPLFLKLLEIPGFYYALSQSDLIVIEMETRILSAFPLFQSNNSNTRLLRPVEKFGEHFTIAFVISGSGQLSEDRVLVAISKLQKKHPFLFLRIHDNENGASYLIPSDTSPLTFDQRPIKSSGATGMCAQINEEVSISRNFHKSTSFFRLSTDPTNDRFELCMTMSHCASDGRSIFCVAHDLFTELSSSSSLSSLLQQQPLYDSIGSLPEDEILRLGPAEIPYDTKTVLAQPKYEGMIVDRVWSNSVECHKFTESETEKILSLIKGKKISLQGLLSTATILASWYISTPQLEKHPESTIIAAPMFAQHLRNFASPKIPDDAIVFGPAQICFSIELRSSEPILDLLKRMSEQIRFEVFEKKSGLRFFHPEVFCPHGGSTWSSHVGTNPLQKKYGSIEIFDCALALSVHSLWEGGVPWGLTTHSHLSLDRLYLNVNTTSPLYSREWSRRYLRYVVAMYETIVEGATEVKAVQDLFTIMSTLT